MSLKAPITNGNILVVNIEGLHNVMAFVQKGKCEQFSVVPGEVGLILSVPVTETVEEQFTGMVHGARARERAANEKPKPKPPTGGGDGTPPNGGTPGSTRQAEYTYTEARAA